MVGGVACTHCDHMPEKITLVYVHNLYVGNANPVANPLNQKRGFFDGSIAP